MKLTPATRLSDLLQSPSSNRPYSKAELATLRASSRVRWPNYVPDFCLYLAQKHSGLSTDQSHAHFQIVLSEREIFINVGDYFIFHGGVWADDPVVNINHCLALKPNA